ncbi:hypothetical protein K9N08_01740 [Candidatus Gracilibacteria bacterium]|nr:hypothetical protein [Candidatus Gracilibacteria bacterium]MCF7856259.1 hypothetical protein [Candidatus Gracilibacteria bacterium]MCF7896262.1 hypothetical protein [Candidatus Gracilibacteria bacterium]
MGIFDSNREIIYTDLDDEVTTIFEQIRRSSHRKIFLVVPARAQILHSLVSLKILRFKSETAGKILTVVTKDAVGRELASEAGVATLESLKPKKTTPKPSPQNLSPKITRSKFKIIELANRAKEKLQKIARDEIPFSNFRPLSAGKKVWSKFAGAAEITEISENGEDHLVVRAPSRRILFSLLAGAAGLLFFIIYIAVPTATIYVTPRSDPISKVVNVNFTDRVTSGSQINETHTIAAELLDFNLARDVRIGATGMIFEGQHSVGEITIFNRSNKDKFIVPSRFQSPEGIIFHTKKAITIPKAIADVPGSVVAEVEACETDDPKCDCINEPEECEGAFVGSRGNLVPTFFILPAIPSLSPSLFWGESKKAFTGGVTKITKFISAEDLENVEETILREIESLAREELQFILAQKNQIENRNLVLLDDKKAIQIEILAIDVPSGLENKQQDDFAVAVSARIQAVAYEADDLRALLFDQLETKVHPDKTLTKINFNNATFQIEEVDFLNSKIKVATTIDGVEEYNLSDETEEGNRLVEKIKSRILGRSTAESEAYIRNLPEVSNAVISSWPFWAHKIPELSENTKFKIKR